MLTGEENARWDYSVEVSRELGRTGGGRRLETFGSGVALTPTGIDIASDLHANGN